MLNCIFIKLAPFNQGIQREFLGGLHPNNPKILWQWNTYIIVEIGTFNTIFPLFKIIILHFFFLYLLLHLAFNIFLLTL